MSIVFDTSGTDYEHLLSEIKRHYSSASPYSEKALELTKSLLALNSAHYSTWIYRRRILRSMDSAQAWEKELVWLNTLMLEEPKTYQLWQHRRLVISHLPVCPIKEEIRFIDHQILVDDSKNYHAWTYKIYLVEISNSQQAQLPASERWIRNDPMNNSAWNYRAFLASAKTADEEVEFVFQFPENPSVQSYLSYLKR